MRNIKKTFEVTTLTAAVVMVNGAGVICGVPIDESVTTFDTVTDKNAVKIFMRGISDPDRFKGKTVKITSKKVENVTFTMTAEDFMKYGTAVEVENAADDFRAE